MVVIIILLTSESKYNLNYSRLNIYINKINHKLENKKIFIEDLKIQTAEEETKIRKGCFIWANQLRQKYNDLYKVVGISSYDKIESY